LSSISRPVSKKFAFVAPFVALMAVAIFAHLPFAFTRKGPSTFDGRFHHAAVVQVADAQRAGDWYPRWLPWQNGGLGDATFMHYSPAFHTLSAISQRLSGGTAWEGMRIVFFLSTLMAALVAFLVFSEYAGTTRAALGAMLLAANPLTLHQIFKPEAFPWVSALPWSIVFFYAASRSDRPQRISLGLALSVAMVCLMHILTAFMLLVSAPIAIVVSCVISRAPLREIAQRFLCFGLSALLGLALSGFYLVPALTTMGLISPAAWAIGGDCTPADSFALPVSALFRTQVLCWDSYQVLFPAISASILVLIAVRRFTGPFTIAEWPKGLCDLLGFGTAALFFATPVSTFLWEHSTVLRFVQFPMRFNAIAFSSLLLAAVIFASRTTGGKRKKLFAGLFISCATLSLAVVLQTLWGKAEVPISDAEGRTGKASLAEYRPATVQPAFREYMSEGGFPKECADIGARCSVLEKGSSRQSFLITASKASSVRVPLFCYPAWVLEENGRATGYSCDPEVGVWRVSVVEGDNTVTFVWKGLPQTQWGGYLSLAALALVTLTLAFRARGPSFTGKQVDAGAI